MHIVNKSIAKNQAKQKNINYSVMELNGFVGRGRGVSTNVPESELIEQVKQRPLLYDKNVKDYRKPGISEQAWMEVANVLQTTVTNCRKRWKSLRDTFIKYYRLDVINRKNGKKNRKTWVYYSDLAFLIPHVDLYRLDDSMKGNESSHSDTIYMKEDYLEADDKHIYFTQDETTENDDSVTYQIKIAKGYDEEHISESIEEDNLLEGHYVEERLDDSAIMDLEDQVVVNKVMQKLETNEHTYMVIEQASEESIKESELEDTNSSYHQQSFKTENLESHIHTLPSSSQQKHVVDPDERYLLSCLPAFKRLTPQQKGLIRMGIERLFYEVEFQNDDEPRNKKMRNS
ncbi:unnamed protein product [Chironomus riparius]|uniref:Transcription factor Adf-1 n=1 Tax=Chironomus riparius TaxID=315576 RepID=A0A9N9RKW7_9DIPT|nr:unnamed protein product [Chironomus riparius]